MNVWLDDERLPPEGWIWVKTPWDAIDLLKTGKVVQISLDNDLGLFNYSPPNEGYHVADWIEENAMMGNLPKMVVTIHTQNPIAKQRMKRAIRNAYKAWESL